MSDEAYISFSCPQCGASVDFLKEFAGTAQACPFCDVEIVVPAADGQQARGLSLPFDTPRLTIRSLAADDLPDVSVILSDPEIFQYDEQAALDEDGCRRWMEQALGMKATDPRAGVSLAIAHRDEQKLIGLLSFRYHGFSRQQGVLNVQIHRDYQRKGLGAEAIAAMLGFCFHDIGLHRVMATCDSRNDAAIHLFTKVGMRQEAECLRDRFVDGQWTDSLWFAMLPEELPPPP